MVYIKKVVCDVNRLAETVMELADWRGVKSGKTFRTINIYLPPHPKHKRAGLAHDKALIIARTG